MEIREAFARNLQRLRAERGYSQEALAHEAGIDRTYVSALERQIYSASLDTVAKLAAALGVASYQLLIEDERDVSRSR